MGLVNPLLLHAASEAMRKTAVVPMPGGQPPMDPAMMAGGGAPPMDPSMMAGGGGAPPMDPMAMALPTTPPPAPAPAGGAAPGAGGSKKIDPQILYTMIYQLMKLNVTIANKLGVTVPPDLLLGMPPDPQAQASTQQMVQGMDASMTAGAVGTGGAMDPTAQGGAPPPEATKVASIGRAYGNATENETSTAFDGPNDLQSVLSNAATLAALSRSLGH